MIPKDLKKYSYNELVYWLRFEAGSSNPDYFKAISHGGLKLQQVPEEYANLLIFIQSLNPKRYLSLGIGNGGSFATEVAMMSDSLIEAIAVDDLSYGHLIGQNGKEVEEFIGMSGFDNCKFINMSTDNYFKFSQDDKFDLIFIDADHSYDGAKKDYLHALKFINKGGHIIFHDINSKACPGVVRLWKEAKGESEWSHEFTSSDTCGIGVIEV
jgi:SAM-dependent methyltransferase